MIFVFFVVRYISGVFNLSFPDNRFEEFYHFYMFHRRDAVFDPEFRPKGAPQRFFIKKFFSAPFAPLR